ncbi:MAG TPA: AI-2E family transporter [Actinomycetales bacterium]|nr:AI-2E family transporter [Actinomycetales bacterium]
MSDTTPNEAFGAGAGTPPATVPTEDVPGTLAAHEDRDGDGLPDDLVAELGDEALAPAEPSGAFGTPGQPMNRHSPFYLGLVGGLGLLAAYGIVLLLTGLSQVLTLVVISLFLALGLDPVVRWLQRLGLRRTYAVLAVFVGVLVVFGGIVALVAPPVVQEAGQLASAAPDYAQSLLKNHTLRQLDDQYGVVDEITKRLKSGSLWTSVFGGVVGAGKAVLSGFFSAFTVLVLTMYFTASLPGFKAAAYRLVPRSRRQRFTVLAEEISRRVGGYVIGQISIATINGIFSFIMMEIVGIPYPAVLAVTVGVLGLIPMVGATLGAVIVVVVALFDSWTSTIIVASYYLVYQQVENYVIVPRIMNRTVAVPGAVTVVAALAGGTLLGILGALMAIPIAAGLLLIYKEVVLPRQEQH